MCRSTASSLRPGGLDSTTWTLSLWPCLSRSNLTSTWPDWRVRLLAQASQTDRLAQHVVGSREPLGAKFFAVRHFAEQLPGAPVLGTVVIDLRERDFPVAEVAQHFRHGELVGVRLGDQEGERIAQRTRALALGNSLIAEAVTDAHQRPHLPNVVLADGVANRSERARVLIALLLKASAFAQPSRVLVNRAERFVRLRGVAALDEPQRLELLGVGLGGFVQLDERPRHSIEQRHLVLVEQAESAAIDRARLAVDGNRFQVVAASW